MVLTLALVSATAAAGGWCYVQVYRRGSPALSALVPSAVSVLPGVYLLGGLEPSAAYAVETRDGLVLVDSGLAADAGALKAQLDTLGLDWTRVRAVLLTHAHGDHTGGAAYLKQAAGAKIYAGRGDADVLKAGGPREAFFSTFYMPGQEIHATPVDVALEGGETLDLGGTRFRAVGTPGHTPGSVCYLMERDGLRVLFAGDVITMLKGDGAPYHKGLKPLGTYSAYLAPRYRGDAKTYLASLEALRAMPAPHLVLPGHPRSDPVPQNPGISAGRWLEILDEGIADMKALVAQLASEGPDFLDGTPRALLPDLFYLGELGGSAVYAIKVDQSVVLIDAPGGAGLPKFLEERLAALGQPAPRVAGVLLTSARPEAMSGLASLGSKDRPPEVYVSPESVDAVKAACPPGTPVRPSTTLSSRHWFPAETFVLRGRGPVTTAYLLRLSGRSVLAAGRFPSSLDQPSLAGLFNDLSTRDDTAEYLDAVTRLGPLDVDLWLPAVPADGQNANLYEGDWPHLIANNLRAGHHALQAQTPKDRILYNDLAVPSTGSTRSTVK